MRAQRTAWLGAAITLAACGAEVPPPAVQTAPTAGELAMAQPAAAGRDDHGVTGVPVQVLLGARRARAAALFHEFLRRVVAHDDAGAAALCSPVVITDTQDEMPNASLVSQLDVLAAGIDPSAVDAQFTNAPPEVYTRRELARTRAVPVAMGPDDLYVLWSTASSFSTRLPAAALLRWNGEEPTVVWIQFPRLARR